MGRRIKDIKTEVKSYNLDYDRLNAGIKGPLIFERLMSDRTWETIGSLAWGWTLAEVTSESASGLPEFQALITSRSGLDALVKDSTAIWVDGTRYEKRAVDPALTSPYVVRLRCQIISGFASKGAA
jgi:hypothetical protein